MEAVSLNVKDISFIRIHAKYLGRLSLTLLYDLFGSIDDIVLNFFT